MFALSSDEIASYLKYAKRNLPRHTSYPAAPYWESNYSVSGVKEALEFLKQNDHPLSLYFHIPYCRQLCFYCACTKEIYPEDRQKKNDPRERLVDGLIRNMHLYSRVLKNNTVKQVHLGGGTPTFLSPAQLKFLFEQMRQQFSIDADAEIAVEIDPRVTTSEHLHVLREMGCNRLSLGVQDFSETVQKAINRIQAYEMVESTISEARRLGFDSINFDLIYGLPFQTVESMTESLKQTLSLAPDRIAFYRLALIPEIFKWQKSFGREHLPSEETNIEIFLSALNMFTKEGYEFIGLDHFAKKNEALSESIQNKTLRRNFQGMTTGKSLAILGVGPSAVSQVPGYFWQNERTSERWLEHLDKGEWVFEKGMKLSSDDCLRQEWIQELYCYGELQWEPMSERLGVDVRSYFQKELESLNSLVDEGIVSLTERGMALSPVLGRLLVRLVAAHFDRYLLSETSRTQSPRFSQLG